ncbi:MAG: hypothetical protein CML73_04225 [Rhodobiaceae bacterium]|nr:hypothetical protein [Rhodobiaceae bacterium]
MATIRKRGRRWEAQVRKAGVTSVNKSFLNKAGAEQVGSDGEVKLCCSNYGSNYYRAPSRFRISAYLNGY